MESDESSIAEAKQYHGCVKLISNVVKDPKETLQIYRNMGLSKRTLGNLKERLSLRRMLVSSETGLDRKLLVHRVALILLSSMWSTTVYRMRTNKNAPTVCPIPLDRAFIGAPHHSE